MPLADYIARNIVGYVGDGLLGGAAAWIINENFVTGSYFPGPITSDIVDTRSTTKFVTGLSGLLSSVAINALPISNAGMLIERPSTNVILQSQAMATSPWVVTAATATNNAAVAPDGTTTATSITDNATSDVHGVNQPAVSPAINGVASVYFKAGSQTWATIQCNYGGGASAAYFNLSGAGTAGSIAVLTGGGPISSSSIQALANGWYRCSVVVSTAIGGIYINPASADGGRVYTGTGAVALYVWGAQGENGTVATSYIPTTTAAATRSGDNAVIQRTGIGTLVYTFDDNSTLTAFADPATKAAISTALPRPLIKSLTGTSATSPTPFRQAVSTTFLPTGTVGAAQAGSYQGVTARVNITSLKVVIPNFSGNENNSAGTLTVRAGVLVNGVDYPLTFGGAVQGVCPAGTNLITSDELSISIPSGTYFFITLWGSSSNSTFCTASDFNQPSGGRSQFGASVPDVTTGSGNLTETFANVAWGVSAVVARHNGRAVGLLGDSLVYGIPGGGPTGGFFAPSLSATLPLINMGLPGDTAQGFLANIATHLQLAAYCTSFATNYGINDLSGSRTGAQVIADRASIAALLPGPLIQSTITPSAASSDNFATAVNQTTLSYNAQRVIVNNSVRSMAKFLEITTPIEFGLNSGIWRSVGDGSVTSALTATASPYQGIHPLPAGYNTVTNSGNVNPALFT